MNRALRIAPALWLCARALAASPDEIAAGATFEPRVGREVPRDLVLHDEDGHTVRFGDFLGAAPVGVVLSYYGCSNLCPAVSRNLARRLAAAEGQASRIAQVVVVSVDPGDTALAGLPARERARWHFLTGGPGEAGAIAGAVGFGFRRDPASGQYAHPAAVTVLARDGRISNYLLGFDYTSAELAAALAGADRGRVADPLRRLVLVCFHYDLATSRTGAWILGLLQALCLAMLACVLVLVAVRRGRARG